jgi:predicted nucleotidyltransferase
MRNPPLQTIQKLIQERYSDAKAVFWGGSVAKEAGTQRSDLDLIIVYEQLSNMYREAFIYDEWPIDAFVHDAETLHYVFEESRTGSGISGSIYMVVHGREVTAPTAFSENIKKLALQYLESEPARWDEKKINKERFFITDVLHDIICPASDNEQIASAAWLYETLSQFYFRANNKWSASGKSIVRYLEADNALLAQEYSKAFDEVFQHGQTKALEKLVKKIVEPFGGLLWDGFKSDGPKESRIKN